MLSNDDSVDNRSPARDDGAAAASDVGVVVGLGKFSMNVPALRIRREDSPIVVRSLGAGLRECGSSIALLLLKT